MQNIIDWSGTIVDDAAYILSNGTSVVNALTTLINADVTSCIGNNTFSTDVNSAVTSIDNLVCMAIWASMTYVSSALQSGNVSTRANQTQFSSIKTKLQSKSV